MIIPDTKDRSCVYPILLLLFLLLFSIGLILFGIGISYLLGVEVWSGAILFAAGYITAAISISLRKKK